MPGAGARHGMRLSGRLGSGHVMAPRQRAGMHRHAGGAARAGLLHQGWRLLASRAQQRGMRRSRPARRQPGVQNPAECARERRKSGLPPTSSLSSLRLAGRPLPCSGSAAARRSVGGSAPLPPALAAACGRTAPRRASFQVRCWSLPADGTQVAAHASSPFKRSRLRCCGRFALRPTSCQRPSKARQRQPRLGLVSRPHPPTFKLASCAFSCFFTRSRFSARCLVNGSSTPVCRGERERGAGAHAGRRRPVGAAAWAQHGRRVQG